MRLVFIHGSGGTSRVWKYQTEHFTGSVAITLPGHPDGPPCESIEGAASWLRSELARQGGAAPLLLVGHSLGGAIALQYALDHGDEVAGIVLVGSGARLRVHPATLEALDVSHGTDPVKLRQVIGRLLAPYEGGGRPDDADPEAVLLPDTRIWTCSGPAVGSAVGPAFGPEQPEQPRTVVTPSGSISFA